MKKILLIVGLTAIYIWQHSGKQDEPQFAFDPNAEIEIYTASYCSECKRAKAYMNARNIAFNEYDVEHDLKRRKEFYARGGKGVPLLFIKGQKMSGFNTQRFEALRRQ